MAKYYTIMGKSTIMDSTLWFRWGFILLTPSTVLLGAPGRSSSDSRGCGTSKAPTGPWRICISADGIPVISCLSRHGGMSHTASVNMYIYICIFTFICIHRNPIFLLGWESECQRKSVVWYLNWTMTRMKRFTGQKFERVCDERFLPSSHFGSCNFVPNSHSLRSGSGVTNER